MSCNSTPTTFEYTLGERVRLSVTVDPPGTADVDFSVDDVTVNLDSETDGTRFTFTWRPTEVGTGSDVGDVFELEDGELFFTLPSAWTAANLTVGRWVCSFSVYDPATEQDEAGVVYLDFETRPGGVLPTS